MEFRRITNLPPYVFTIINNLKIEARRAGADVIDLGFGNPDIPSPDIAVEKLAEAARIPRNHRYSLSRGLPKLREAVAALYLRNWGVELDPELEITNTIGSKEGFSHLMWVLLERGDAAIVPSPSYPIHIYGPLFAGADLRQVPMRGLSDPRTAMTSPATSCRAWKRRGRSVGPSRGCSSCPSRTTRPVPASTSSSCSGSSTSAASGR